MLALEELGRVCRSLDGKGYKAYKRLEGRYRVPAPDCTLHIEHVQGDPFADPSRLRVELPSATASLPSWSFSTASRRRATADFLNRRLHAALADASGKEGSGRSGELAILRPSQAVLTRASLGVDEKGSVRARFRVGLPARGRRILGNSAARILTTAMPHALGRALVHDAARDGELLAHVETVEDACALRAQLAGRGLVAFVADGSSLPRRSGIDDRPLAAERSVPFRSPEGLRTVLDTPNSGSISGLGIPAGVTLIVGGGYHGKSTLLRAIARGIHDHVPGDGRERVVTLESTVKVRAEDGRYVADTDIGNFIGALPGGLDTRRFHSENASGSTSQATAIIEALELGSELLLLDEDTSATNFMIRDARMQELVADEFEPITPFLDRARQLAEDVGVSTILVVGGSGDYFDVADTVIAMKEYRPSEVTAEARLIAHERPSGRRREGGEWRPIAPRAPQPGSIDPRRGRRAVDIRVRAIDRVDFGNSRVELAALEQLVEVAQTRAIAHALASCPERALTGAISLRDVLAGILTEARSQGLESLHPHRIGELADFRIFELGAFLVRLRTLRIERPA